MSTSYPGVALKRAKRGEGARVQAALVAVAVGGEGTKFSIPESDPPKTPPAPFFATTSENLGTVEIQKALALIGKKYKLGQKTKTYNAKTAAAKVGAPYYQVWRRSTGRTKTSKRGSPPKNTEEHLKAIVQNIRSNQRNENCQLPDSVFIELADLADQDGAGYADHRMPPSTRRRYTKRVQDLTKRESMLPGADKSIGVVGISNALSTVKARLAASKPKVTRIFYKSTAKVYEEHPALRNHPEAHCNVDGG